MLTIPGYRILETEPRGESKLVGLRCESLNGGLPAGASARLYPGGRRIRIKAAAGESGIHRLKVKGAPRSDLFPGAVIIGAEWPVEEEKEGLFFHDGGEVPGEAEAVRGGLCIDFNRERFISRGQFRRDGSFLAVRFPQAYPMLPGMDCSILDSGGRPRRLTLLVPGRPTADEMRRLNGTAPRRPDPHPSPTEALGRILYARGWVKAMPGAVGDAPEGTGRAGAWLIADDERIRLEKKILKLASRPGGAGDAVLRIDGRPESLIRDLAAAMAGCGTLTERGGWYFPPGPPPLSPFHRGWLGRIEEAGTDGFRLSGLRGRAERDAVDVLLRSGLVRGGDTLCFGLDAFEELAEGLLAGLERGDGISMAEARDRLGGSRAGTLEVLTALEKDGRLLPSEDGEGRVRA